MQISKAYQNPNKIYKGRNINWFMKKRELKFSYSTKSQTAPTRRGRGKDFVGRPRNLENRRGKDFVGKRGQVTIFIIIGVLIVSVIGAYLAFREGIIPSIGGGADINPNAYLEACMEEKIQETIDILSTQGGYIENPLHKLYDDKKISYLCYNRNYYLTCINQEPMLIKHLIEEIETYTKDDMDTCIEDLKESLEKQNYDVEATYDGFNVSIAPKKMIFEINAELKLTKTGETSGQKGFKVIKLTRFYDLAVLAQEIVSQEAEFCEFQQLGYMLLHSGVRIQREVLVDGTTIYFLQDRKTKEEFWFAVRSCALPGGV